MFAQSQEISSYANNRLKYNKIKQKHDFNDSSLSEFQRQKFLYEFDELLLLIENTQRRNSTYNIFQLSIKLLFLSRGNKM